MAFASRVRERTDPRRVKTFGQAYIFLQEFLHALLVSDRRCHRDRIARALSEQAPNQYVSVSQRWMRSASTRSVPVIGRTVHRQQHGRLSIGAQPIDWRSKFDESFDPIQLA